MVRGERGKLASLAM